MAGDEVVVALVDRARLPVVLSAIHRGGFGHQARVLDPSRADLGGQLRAASVDIRADELDLTGDRVAVVISAAARSAMARALLVQQGAQDARIARAGATGLPALSGLLARPTARRGRAPAAATPDRSLETP